MPASTPLKDDLAQATLAAADFADESYHRARRGGAAQGFHGVNVKLVKTEASARAWRPEGRAQSGLKTMIGCMIETSILINAAAHLAELCDYLDVDGNILITNDPYVGVTLRRHTIFCRRAGKIGLAGQPKAVAGQCFPNHDFRSSSPPYWRWQAPASSSEPRTIRCSRSPEPVAGELISMPNPSLKAVVLKLLKNPRHGAIRPDHKAIPFQGPGCGAA